MSHNLLYGLLVFMPVTGISMGVAGGRGVPFFGLFTIPGFKEPAKEAAGFFYNIHTQVGYWLPYILGIHLSASLYHHFVLKDMIFKRILL